MKLFIKIKRFLYKNAISMGVFLLFLSVYFTWEYRPVIFYPQEKGILVDVFDTISYQQVHSHRFRYKYVPVYLFYVNDVVYRIEHLSKSKNKNFNYLKNKKIDFRYEIGRYGFFVPQEEYFKYNDKLSMFTAFYYPSYPKRRIIREIICDRVVIYRDEHLTVLFVSLIILILSLTWVIWAFIKFWKKDTPKQPKLKEGEEEYFFENWRITKAGNKYALYYISRLDNGIKAIRITEEEFLSAKNGKMTLEDFSLKYNLW
jgi:hypothetical protein